MPGYIRAALICFFLAFLCESLVEIVLLGSYSLPWVGYLAVLASLVANPLAIGWALQWKKRGYDLLKWIAAFTLAWTIAGGSYVSAIGLWAITLIACCAWLRVGAVFMLRHKSAKRWIETAIKGAEQ